jgi:murein L,D-transpeptidase YafK
MRLARLAACAGLFAFVAPAARASDKAEAPVPAATVALMASKNMAPSAPIVVRSYKKESILEVWKQTRGGRYALLKSFPICRWSGQLGPKTRQGDRQTPEGFYSVGAKQMNPNSAYYLSFDTGFPNAYDRAHGATGAYLMVHGTCSSAGCYAMTDRQIAEIYALARDALAAGQPAFQFQGYPFRMTAENMARYRSDPHIGFWRQLKDGSDRFEATGEEPLVAVVNGRYAFSSRTPALDGAATARRTSEDAHVTQLVSDGAAAIRTTYSDGGQNAIFAALARQGENLGDISRPEALAFAGREIVVIPARKPHRDAKPVEIASAKAAPKEFSSPPLEANAIPAFRMLMSGASPILDASLAPLAAGARL